VKGVTIYRDLVVLWMRSGGNGREEDGAEKEALEKHSDGVWRRWASERPNPQESVLIRGGECRRGRRVFLGAEHTGRKKVGISALHDGPEERHQLSPPPSRINLFSLARAGKNTTWVPSGLVVSRAASPSDWLSTCATMSHLRHRIVYKGPDAFRLINTTHNTTFSHRSFLIQKCNLVGFKCVPTRSNERRRGNDAGRESTTRAMQASTGISAI
jgi:hypothetical protein